MASTKAPLAAWTYGYRLIRKMMPAADETALQAQILDNAAKWFWMESAWRWTTGTLNNINLSTDAQDYAYGSTVPSDYLYTQFAYLSDGNTTRALTVASSLPSTSVIKGRPEQICKITGDNFRVWPNPGTLGSTQTIVQIYKKAQTPITAGNVNSAVLAFDDEWFPVYQEIVNWYLYQYAYDDRAGTAQIDSDGKIVYAGQIGVIKAMVAEMRRRDTLTPEMDTRPIQNEPIVKRR